MTIETAVNRPSLKTSLCDICKKPFILNKQLGWKVTKAFVEEIKVNDFRGDDIVKFYHIECKRGDYDR